MILVLYCLLFLGPALFAIGYLNAFAFARLFGIRESRWTDEHSHRFLLLIPAHNEQDTIHETLRSISAISYDAAKLNTVVIADNCTDKTVDIVRASGFQCLERSDRNHVGKGFAISWALQQIDLSDFDVVAMVDADCPIESNLLEVFDAFFGTGAQAVQSNHQVTNADASPIAYAAAVGRSLEYDLLYAPKSSLRLPVMLVGTGMAFRRDLLESIPWNSHSLAEDTEFTLELGKHGISVRFASNAFIHCSGATSRRELNVQRTRWATGNIKFSRTRSLWLIVRGLITGRPSLSDLGILLLLTSRPLVMAHALITIGIGTWLFLAGTHSAHTTAGAISWVLLPAYAVWISIGIGWVGLNPTRLLHLAQTPVVLGQLVWIALRAAILGNKQEWQRTPRASKEI